MKRLNSTEEESGSFSEEIASYIDLGMKGEALSVARKALVKKCIDPAEFHEAVRAIGVHARDMRKWKQNLEAAYERQSAKAKREMAANMLTFYCAIEDKENAQHFLTPLTMKGEGEALLVMELLLEAERFAEARTHVIRCKRWLNRTEDPFLASLFIEAMAIYFCRSGKWDVALYLWTQAPLDQPLRQNALSGTVNIYLAYALQAAKNGLVALSELKKNIDTDTALQLPGLDDGLTEDAEKELRRLKRGIEKLLPEEQQAQFGMEIFNE